MNDLLKEFCREKNIENESECIRQAIVKYITPIEYKDETLKLQAMKNTMEKTDELRDMIEILFGYIRLMHMNLMAYLPEIDSSLIDAAFLSATTRHSVFFSSFQESLKNNNPPFFERLLHKYYTESGNG